MATVGLLPLRIVVGLVFLMHGGVKYTDFGLAGVTDMLGKLGFFLPQFWAVVLMLVEPLGGAAILLGIGSQVAGLLLAVEMVVAILVARMGGGFFTPYGYEFELTLLGACLTLAAMEPGPMSVAAWLRARSGAKPGA